MRFGKDVACRTFRNRDNRTDQQLLDEALNVARRADIIIAALGESSEMSGESSSRTDLNIPDVQQNGIWPTFFGKVMVSFPPGLT